MISSTDFHILKECAISRILDQQLKVHWLQGPSWSLTMRTPRNPNPTSHRFHPQKAPGFWPTKKSMYRCCADRTGFLGFVQSSEDVLACFFSIYINVVWNFPLMEKDLVCLQLCCSCCMQLLVFEGVAVACFVKERFAPFRVSNLSPQFR